MVAHGARGPLSWHSANIRLGAPQGKDRRVAAGSSPSFRRNFNNASGPGAPVVRIIPYASRTSAGRGGVHPMMIALVIAACLGTEECRDFSLLYDPGDVSLMTCMIAGQAEIARWQETHPHWRVTRWSCGIHDPRTAEL
jgi:hypothetical protein